MHEAVFTIYCTTISEQWAHHESAYMSHACTRSQEEIDFGSQRRGQRERRQRLPPKKLPQNRPIQWIKIANRFTIYPLNNASWIPSPDQSFFFCNFYHIENKNPIYSFLWQYIYILKTDHILYKNNIIEMSCKIITTYIYVENGIYYRSHLN